MKWIRPLISLIAMAAMTAGFFLKLVSGDIYVPIATGAIVWWYTSRDKEKKVTTP